MEVVIVKLVSGEELIGEAVENGQGASIILRKPAVIHVVDAPSKKQNKINMKFVPYAIFSKDQKIVVTAYTWVSGASDSIAEQYEKAFSDNKIIVPDKEIILA